MAWGLLPVFLVIVAWAFARFHLLGEDLGRYDEPRHPPLGGDGEPSEEHAGAVRTITGIAEQMRRLPRKERLVFGRRAMDELGTRIEVEARIVEANANGVPAEWVIAPAAEAGRRLLYLHGGSFMLGSPRSHRIITAKLSEVARASVLALDYRLMPEHQRIDGIVDCRAGYLWILENGPEGASPVERLFVAGDSAGGSLALATLAWARDQGLRPADGAVALSPGTDSTLTSPSLRRNVATDPMLGPGLGSIFARVPSPVIAWFSWWNAGIHPADPRVSPLRGDLSGLPPILIHASEHEMLLDDARRYANKARAEGSPVELETWAGMLHVWHAFEPTVPEAKEAFERIGAFLARCEASAADPIQQAG